MAERPSMYFTLTPEQLRDYVIDDENNKPKPPKRGKKETRAESGISKEIQESIEALQLALTQRASEFNLSAPKLDLPPVPPDFTKEHLEALGELFGANNLEATVCPKPENLTDEYFEIMYPKTQRDADTRNGLTSFRGDWWGKTADEGFSITEKQAKQSGQKRATWGELYYKSMRAESVNFQDTVIFSETIQKPKYLNGAQHYGTESGTDATADHLLPVIQEVFGASANRFDLTWDKINQELIPKVKQKITEIFALKGLSVPVNLEVVCTPAVVSNLQTTLKHPTDSKTDTYDWSSTPLINQEDKDSGYRLLVGHSDNGGAGCVNRGHRGRSWRDRGFRLSVVLKKP